MEVYFNNQTGVFFIQTHKNEKTYLLILDKQPAFLYNF